MHLRCLVLFLDVLLVALIHAVAEVLPLGGPGAIALFTRMAPGSVEASMLAVAVQVGILAALTCYFWRDVLGMIVGVGRLPKGRLDPGGRLALQLALGSLPALALVVFAPAWVNGGMGMAVPVVAGLVALFGLLLLLADHLGVTVHRIEHLGWRQLAVVGLLQAFALLPGIGRVGLGVTAARLLGYERRDAARLALLLLLPLLVAQVVMTLRLLSGAVDLHFAPDMLLVTGGVFVVAWGLVAGMMGWLRRHGFGPFGWARVAVGAGCAVWIFIFG
jgi:undecaprenyl-diphosphatase